MAQSEETEGTTAPKPPTAVEHLPETEEKSKLVEEDEEEDEFEDEDEDEYDDEDEEQPPLTPEAKLQSTRKNMEYIVYRMALPDGDGVPIRVHDVIVKGNVKTKDSLIESEVELLKEATTMRELLQASGIVNARLQQLQIFESVSVTIDAGPPELPGTANVIVEVGEVKNPLTGDLGVFSRPEARSWSLEGAVKLRNFFGYGDIWDGSLAYGWNQSSEISVGVHLPRFRSLMSPVSARISLLSQDWLKFSSYKERALGLSLGLLSDRFQDLSYNLSWRNLTDPTQMSSSSVRRQLGHSLLSALKYTFKFDRRDSAVRPTRGYAFAASYQLGGLLPDYRSLRFARQEFDFRCAFPLKYLNAALNVGVSAGVVLPWGSGFLSSLPSYLPEKFFLGGGSSPVCTLGGPLSLLGFKPRGLGPTAPRRQVKEPVAEEGADNSPEVDFIGGDLALTGFADLSFDIPLKVFKDAGIHGHAFACSGSLNNLTQNSHREVTWSRFKDSFRSTVGFGLVVPTRLFRMEVNYCHIIRQQEHDKGKTGLQFSFSSPS